MWLALVLSLQAEMSARDVVEWMEAHTKHRFIHPATMDLSKMKIRCRKEDLDPARAYEAGLALLKTVQLVPIRKRDAGVVDLLHAAVAAKYEVPVYHDVERLPAADEFCTLVLKTKFIGARDAQAAFINMVGFPQNVLSVEAAGTLMVTDYAPNLRRLAGLLADMDKPGPELTLRLLATDVDWVVRKFLDTRFGALAAEEVARIPALLEGLGSDGPGARETAARAIEAMGPNAGPHLAPGLTSGDVEIRSRTKAILYAWAKDWAAR